MKQMFSSIVSNHEVMPGVYLTWLKSPHMASTAQPGQFVMVRCGEDFVLRRPLSIHQLDGEDKFALLFTVGGKGTYWLSQRQAGETIDLVGPLGNSYAIQSHSHNLLLVAGGMGIAPLRFLADAAANQGIPVTLLYGASSSMQLLPTAKSPHELLTKGVSPFNINTVKVTDDGSEGFRGLATDLIVNHIDWADQLFACGPLPMYKTMAQMTELKDKPVQISLEVRMACGLGVCYGCTVKTNNGLKQVCRDGPVFKLDDIVWDEVAKI